MERTCSVEDCTKKHYGRGYCKYHWKVWHVHGDASYNPPTHDQLFQAKVNTDGPWSDRLQSNCWIWTGGLSHNGYGLVKRDRKTQGAHRLAWEVANGPIPDGLFVLHHCDNPPCVRVDHFFLGTKQDNAQDAVSKGRHKSQLVTHCPQGHEYTPENTKLKPLKSGTVGRECRTCNRIAAREYHRLHRAQASAT